MRVPQQDHYAILGVAPDAGPAQITHAYRTLLRRHHPDTRAHASDSAGEDHDAALQRILTAYEVLHDPHQRAAYDQRLQTPTQRRRASAPPRDQPLRATRPRYDPAPPIQAGPVRWHYRAAERT
jgi:DnaJ-class molecular chaperone